MATTPNILEYEDYVKGLPTSTLQQVLSNPSNAPQLSEYMFLVTAELADRKKQQTDLMARQGARENAGYSSVAQELAMGDKEPMSQMAAAPTAGPPMVPPQSQLASAMTGLDAVNARSPNPLPNMNAAGGLYAGMYKAVPVESLGASPQNVEAMRAQVASERDLPVSWGAGRPAYGEEKSSFEKGGKIPTGKRGWLAYLENMIAAQRRARGGQELEAKRGGYAGSLPTVRAQGGHGPGSYGAGVGHSYIGSRNPDASLSYMRSLQDMLDSGSITRDQFNLGMDSLNNVWSGGGELGAVNLGRALEGTRELPEISNTPTQQELSEIATSNLANLQASQEDARLRGVSEQIQDFPIVEGPPSYTPVEIPSYSAGDLPEAGQPQTREIAQRRMLEALGDRDPIQGLDGKDLTLPHHQGFAWRPFTVDYNKILERQAARQAARQAEVESLRDGDAPSMPERLAVEGLDASAITEFPTNVPALEKKLLAEKQRSQELSERIDLAESLGVSVRGGRDKIAALREAIAARPQIMDVSLNQTEKLRLQINDLIRANDGSLPSGADGAEAAETIRSEPRLTVDERFSKQLAKYDLKHDQNVQELTNNKRDNLADRDTVQKRMDAIQEFAEGGALPEKRRKRLITDILLTLGAALTDPENHTLYGAISVGLTGIKAVAKEAREEYAKSLSTLLAGTAQMAEINIGIRDNNTAAMQALSQGRQEFMVGAMDRLEAAEQRALDHNLRVRQLEQTKITTNATLLTAYANIAKITDPSLQADQVERIIGQQMISEYQQGMQIQDVEERNTWMNERFIRDGQGGWRRPEVGDLSAGIMKFWNPHILGTINAGSPYGKYEPTSQALITSQELTKTLLAGWNSDKPEQRYVAAQGYIDEFIAANKDRIPSDAKWWDNESGTLAPNLDNPVAGDRGGLLRWMDANNFLGFALDRIQGSDARPKPPANFTEVNR